MFRHGHQAGGDGVFLRAGNISQAGKGVFQAAGGHAEQRARRAGVRFAAVESEGEIARFSGERAQAGLGLDDEGDVRLGGGDAQPRALGALCIDLAGEALALGRARGRRFSASAWFS